MLNCCSSSQCWSMIPSLMQAWIRYPIPSLFGSFAAYCHQYSFYVLRTLSMSFGTLLQVLARGMPLYQSASRLGQNRAVLIIKRTFVYNQLVLQFIIMICLGSVLMQMPEADAGAVHRAANQNRNLFLKRVHIIPKDIKNSSKNIGIVRRNNRSSRAR